MGSTTTRRKGRDPNSRQVAFIPEQPLQERVLELAAPLLERLGTDPAPEAVRGAVDLAIAFWNAKAQASKIWGPSRPKALNGLQRTMTGKKATAEDSQAFELLTSQWRAKQIAFDPRLVGQWSLELGDDGRPRLSCEMELPDGVEAHVPEAIEKRVAIGGKFLDETQIRLTATSSLRFPVKAHRGRIGNDGSVMVRTKMPIALALLAEGVLPAIGGASVGLTVQGKRLEAMVLSEIRCDANGGHYDIAILTFKPASESNRLGPP